MEAETVAATDLPQTTKKRSSGLSFLRAALAIIFNPSCKKPRKAVKNDLLSNILGAVRPLHSHHALDHDPRASTAVGKYVRRPGSREVFLLPPPSPYHSDDWAACDGMSRYTSAEDLQALETRSEEGGEEVDESRGPSAIDLKAEEFITAFYEQMRLQRMDSMS